MQGQRAEKIGNAKFAGSSKTGSYETEGSANLLVEGTSKTCCNYHFKVLLSCHLKQKRSNKLTNHTKLPLLINIY